MGPCPTAEKQPHTIPYSCSTKLYSWHNAVSWQPPNPDSPIRLASSEDSMEHISTSPESSGECGISSKDDIPLKKMWLHNRVLQMMFLFTIPSDSKAQMMLTANQMLSLSIKLCLLGLCAVTGVFHRFFQGSNELIHTKWAQNGVMPQSTQELWSSWSSWTSCSSSCGDGVALRARKCIWATRERCSGEYRQYRSCQSAICPEDSLPFRNMQCALYNYKPILGTHEKYQWVPFYGAPTACDLNCLAIGHNFYYSFGRVLDGTRCGPDSGGICINGLCQISGCDGILGSEVITDSCGACGGNNDSYVFIQRVFQESFPSTGIFGYKNVSRIPAGATQIKVTDRSRNFLALMRSNRRYVVNGNWAVSWPGVYNVAGTEVHYNRTEANYEILEAAGPTNEDLYIMVLFQEHNPGIEYEFWLPKNTFHSITEDFQDHSSANQRNLEQVPRVNKTQPSYQRTKPMAAELKEDPVTVKKGVCRKCPKHHGRAKRIKNYCQSDFVIRAKVLGRRLVGYETRYDIKVKYVYKNMFPIMHREYIWVTNTCDCPQLQDRREYILMASRHVNFEQTLNRIILSAKSYVRLWSPHEDQQLQQINKLCSTAH
ncbi:ADAMTS-like protein 5 [Pelodytes ibericus]